MGIENMIVIALLAVVVGAAIAYMVKAKRNGAKCIGCPSGGSCPHSGTIKKKKLKGRVIGKKILKISGMTCEHCVVQVTKTLNQIEGVSAVVRLSTGSAQVSYDREIADSTLKNAVEGIGYRVTDIS